MSRPEQQPSWVNDDSTAKAVEPSATKKLQGWIYKESVPFQFWNWVFRNFVKWILHLDVSVNHFDPHEASTPNMTVVLSAGRVQNGVTLIETAEQATATITAPSANPRIDRVVIDNVTGTVSVIAGSEAASPVAPTITLGRIAVAQVLLQTSSTEITNSMIADERATKHAHLMTWTSAAAIGSSLAIAGLANADLDALNGTDVVIIDSGQDLLRTYRFNGSVWALVGSGLTITGIGPPALAALNGTDVAFIDATINELRTYRFNGSVWALVGSGFAIAGSGFPALAALNGTDVAFIDATINELRTYRFNGSVWALVGSGFAIAGAGDVDLAALNGTDVAFIDSTNDELRTYRFNGSVWALVGSGLTITGAGVTALAALNGTDVAFIDSPIGELRAYRFGFHLGDGPYRPS